MTKDFESKGAIVTGGGSGIGRATALELARRGALVVVADLVDERAQEVVAEIVAAGGAAKAVVGDLSDQEVVDAVVRCCVEATGGVDVLINNAGIMDQMSAPNEVSDAEWERVIRINLTAPFMMTRAVSAHMLAKGSGSIVYTGSEAGLRGSAAGTAYTASKHGVIGLVKAAAVQFRGKGIRVNAVAPGGVMTNLEVTMDPTAAGPAAVGSYMANVGRIADPQEVAAAIVFLASDAASNVSGAILPVDSGWSAI
jgi:NAD(P)-dependent dehydrogenase (short-subunit alcohol dehydrogenase family)